MRKGRKGNRRMQSHLHSQKKVKFDQKIRGSKLQWIVIIVTVSCQPIVSHPLP